MANSRALPVNVHGRVRPRRRRKIIEAELGGEMGDAAAMLVAAMEKNDYALRGSARRGPRPIKESSAIMRCEFGFMHWSGRRGRLPTIGSLQHGLLQF